MPAKGFSATRVQPVGAPPAGSIDTDSAPLVETVPLSVPAQMQATVVPPLFRNMPENEPPDWFVIEKVTSHTLVAETPFAVVPTVAVPLQSPFMFGYCGVGADGEELLLPPPQAKRTVNRTAHRMCAIRWSIATLRSRALMGVRPTGTRRELHSATAPRHPYKKE